MLPPAGMGLGAATSLGSQSLAVPPPGGVDGYEVAGVAAGSVLTGFCEMVSPAGRGGLTGCFGRKGRSRKIGGGFAAGVPVSAPDCACAAILKNRKSPAAVNRHFVLS